MSWLWERKEPRGFQYFSAEATKGWRGHQTVVNSVMVRSVLSAYKAFKWRFQLGSEIDMSKAQGRLVWNFSV